MSDDEKKPNVFKRPAAVRDAFGRPGKREPAPADVVELPAATRALLQQGLELYAAQLETQRADVGKEERALWDSTVLSRMSRYDIPPLAADVIAFADAVLAARRAAFGG